MCDDDELAEVLAKGPVSIFFAARFLGWPPSRVYATAKADKSKFSVIGIIGAMGTWSVGLSEDRPIHLVMPAAWRKELE